ncbi:MAG: hypothetical protein MSS69_03570, partial [Spirochaetales bacterium]|nr:hypothetical protein [Spirochaetales bacterium]MCI7605818.1 hypothetical protein [Spirochaetales bacterium]
SVHRQVSSVNVPASYALADGVQIPVLSIGNDNGILRSGDRQYLLWYRHGKFSLYSLTISYN